MEHKPSPVIRPESLSSPVSSALIARLNEELSGRYPEAGATHFRLDPHEVAPGVGVFLVAYDGEAPVGCGALRGLDAATMEIKRMFVVPEGRRRGIGRALLRALLEQARALGRARVVLETGVRQGEAITLYEQEGFVRIPLFGEYLGASLSVCMERRIAGIAPA